MPTTLTKPVDIMKKITELTQQDKIIWNRFAQGRTHIIKNEVYITTPKSNALAWSTYVILKQKFIVPATFSARVIVAGNHVQNLVDQTTGGVRVDLINPNAPFKVKSASLKRDVGELELTWESYREDHQIIADYTYTRKDVDVGDLNIVYYTGKTPWSPESTYAWGVATTFGPRVASSSLKVRRMMIYDNNGLPTYILEPKQGSTEEILLNSLFTYIEAQVVRCFWHFLNVEICPPAPPPSNVILQ